MPFNFTKENLELIKHLSPGIKQKALTRLGRIEFDKCANDPIYWLDAKQHAVPYVYTYDQKTLCVCRLCGPEYEDIAHTMKRRGEHLQGRHMLNVDKDKLKDYFYILPKIRPFIIKPYMPPIVTAWLDTNLFALEKSRDMMATWLMVALATWDCFFHEGTQHIFQSETAPKTLELVKRASFMVERQPKWLVEMNPPDFSQGPNRSGILLFPKFNSDILGFPQGPDQIRQYHPTGVFQDEAAFQDRALDAFQAIKPAIQEGGKFYAISSANPGWFESLCGDFSDEE